MKNQALKRFLVGIERLSPIFVLFGFMFFLFLFLVMFKTRCVGIVLRINDFDKRLEKMENKISQIPTPTPTPKKWGGNFPFGQRAQ